MELTDSHLHDDGYLKEKTKMHEEPAPLLDFSGSSRITIYRKS
ncbi:hypothetical protein [Planococcus halotolerans]|nr:hypothetical protein [Planococcus halotolerans]